MSTHSDMSGAHPIEQGDTENSFHNTTRTARCKQKYGHFLQTSYGSNKSAQGSEPSHDEVRNCHHKIEATYMKIRLNIVVGVSKAHEKSNTLNIRNTHLFAGTHLSLTTTTPGIDLDGAALVLHWTSLMLQYKSLVLIGVSIGQVGSPPCGRPTMQEDNDVRYLVVSSIKGLCIFDYNTFSAHC